MKQKEERCSNCAHCLKCGDGYICNNFESDMYTLYVEYETSCEFWEER